MLGNPTIPYRWILVHTLLWLSVGFQAESLRLWGSIGEDSKALRDVMALEMATGVRPHLFQGIHPERAPGIPGQGLWWRFRIYDTFSGYRQSQVSLTVMPVFFLSSSSYPSPMPPHNYLQGTVGLKKARHNLFIFQDTKPQTLSRTTRLLLLPKL